MLNSITDSRTHRYWSERNLTLLEHLPSSDFPRLNPVLPNTLLFIGGLYDSFCSVPYVYTLASHLSQRQQWTLMEVKLSSSGLGWANGNLDRDVDEIGRAVVYIRGLVRSAYSETSLANGGGKVVLMGHSTGSQDVLHYLYRKSEQERPPVDGAILQAAVSDREALAVMREGSEDVQHAYDECLRMSLDSNMGNPPGKICTLPLELTTILGWPKVYVSYERFLSLASPFSPLKPGPDDLFSSDLSEETLQKTFGEVGRCGMLTVSGDSRPSTLILLSADDEYTPKPVDKEGLLRRWRLALEYGSTDLAPGSGIIAGASHNVKEYSSQLDLIKRVSGYLDSITGAVQK